MGGLAAAAAVLFIGGCVQTKIHGRVVSCADGAPIEGAKITVAEASTDPSVTTTETSNYYDGPSEGDGTFGVMTGSSEPTACATKASKKGFKERRCSLRGRRDHSRPMPGAGEIASQLSLRRPWGRRSVWSPWPVS
jgi:hypothetical protein